MWAPLIAGLLCLLHAFNLSIEQVVAGLEAVEADGETSGDSFLFRALMDP